MKVFASSKVSLQFQYNHILIEVNRMNLSSAPGEDLSDPLEDLRLSIQRILYQVEYVCQLNSQQEIQMGMDIIIESLAQAQALAEGIKCRGSTRGQRLLAEMNLFCELHLGTRGSSQPNEREGRLSKLAGEISRQAYVYRDLDFEGRVDAVRKALVLKHPEGLSELPACQAYLETRLKDKKGIEEIIEMIKAVMSLEHSARKKRKNGKKLGRNEKEEAEGEDGESNDEDYDGEEDEDGEDQDGGDQDDEEDCDSDAEESVQL